MSELKRCPWCNCEPSMRQMASGDWVIWCANEDCTVRSETDLATEAAAIAAWNRRPSPDWEVVGAGIADIAAERQRQREVEGWTEEHDDAHSAGEMAAAAACYAAPFRVFQSIQHVGRGYEPLTVYVDGWPWHDEWWKPKDRRHDLVRAAALILAEIERLDRAAIAAAGGEG